MSRNKRQVKKAMTQNSSLEDQKLKELHVIAQEIREMAHNATANSLRQMVARSGAISGGYDFADTLHNIYLDYGYPDTLTFTHFWNMYRRFGVAQRVIELPVDTCWSTEPLISADNTVINSIEKVNSRINLWKRLRGLDVRQRVGRYAGMFMRVRDGKKPSEPLESLAGESSLVDIIPLYESQLEVVQSNTDATSDDYGKPIMLQYSQGVDGNRNEEAQQTINIHASRVVFAAEGADDGWIYGVPALESIYNDLMDLRKISGGSAEGFYKNAAQSVLFNLKDPSTASAYADKLAQFNDQYDEFTRNRTRRAMWTPGMDASVLTAQMADPQSSYNVSVNNIAAGCGIAASLLIGRQNGERVSAEDSNNFLSLCQSRRLNFCTEMTESVIDWMMLNGVVAMGGYEVGWDDLMARSDTEKLEAGKSMTQINRDNFLSGGGRPFTDDEIREAAGYEAMEGEEELPSEEIDIDDPSESDQ